MNERKRIFKQIQVYDFAVHEAILYLNGHPNDKKALDFYKRHNAKLKELTSVYEKKYGPLTAFSNEVDTWQWTECAWPWEYDSI